MTFASAFGNLKIESVEQVEDTNPNLYVQRAEQALIRESIEEALREVDKAIQFSNDNGNYIFEKVKILFTSGRYQECKKLIEQKQQVMKTDLLDYKYQQCLDYQVKLKAKVEGKLPTTNPVIHVTGISLNRVNLVLKIGESDKLTANILPVNATNKHFEWRSKNTTIVSVDKQGNVKARGIGKTMIMAVTQDGNYSTYCNIEVKPIPVERITFDKSEIVLKKGQEENLAVTVFPWNATNKAYHFTSSKPSVIQIDENGLIKGLKGGKTTITVATEDGNFMSECTVIVKSSFMVWMILVSFCAVIAFKTPLIPIVQEFFQNNEMLEKQYLAVTVKNANIRMGPSIDYEVLEVVSYNTYLEFLEEYWEIDEEENWYRISFGEGQEGWIHSSIVVWRSQGDFQQHMNSLGQYITVDAEYANIRTGPGRHYEVLQVVPYSTFLEFLGEDIEESTGETWYSVRTQEGEEGWIHNNIVSW
ncbi:Ig-like domain-containing bacterial surface protein [Clostridium aceticum]|uniref:Ig-like domain-containing bacterial surface protein n=1 Tax=Clostridium aceticum TaxID=84022 RepID=A0A0G3WAL2_9CLOT|nr:Ig-like domain-containing protein [Clostridium aceticum]AKL95681.1 Ig-like domain-containing bacterial surface protein [Clostridium aceticum]